MPAVDTINPRAALLIVDVQVDFCRGGALAVPGSDQVVASLNRYLREAVDHSLPIYASRDWHPAASTHFAANGGEWPMHCVQDTAGAGFHPSLLLPRSTTIITKGEQPDAHGYSAFEGHTPDGAALLDTLRARGVTHLFVGGLATDYCVRASVLDALANGLSVTLLEDAVAGVDRRPGDSARALTEMRDRGASLRAGGGSLFG